MFLSSTSLQAVRAVTGGEPIIAGGEMALQGIAAIKDNPSECTGANAREGVFYLLCCDSFRGSQNHPQACTPSSLTFRLQQSSALSLLGEVCEKQGPETVF